MWSGVAHNGVFYLQDFFQDIAEQSKILDSFLESGCDEDIVIEETLLNEVEKRFIAVREMAESRLVKLTHEDIKRTLLMCMDSGRKQLTLQPIKFASRAQMEQVLDEHMVSWRTTAGLLIDSLPSRLCPAPSHTPYPYIPIPLYPHAPYLWNLQ